MEDMAEASNQEESKPLDEISQESDEEIFELAMESGLISSGSFTIEDKVSRSSKFLQLKSKSSCVSTKFSGKLQSTSNPTTPKTHFLNLRKKKLSDASNGETWPPAEPSSTRDVESANLIESLKGQVNFHSAKAIESKERAMKLSKSLDHLRSKCSQMEKLVRLKDSQLNEKIERSKITANTLKQHRDKIEKLKEQMTNFKKNNSELQEKLKAKTELNSKLQSEVQNMKRESKLMMMSNESLVSELNQISPDKKKKKETEAGQKIENLQIELNSRDLQIDILNLEMNRLKDENKSLKNHISNENASSTETTKLNREISQLKYQESHLKDELRNLISQLEQQQSQRSANERLMQLRGEFVMTIQDQNRADNARLVLQVKNMDQIEEEDEEDSEY